MKWKTQKALFNIISSCCKLIGLIIMIMQNMEFISKLKRSIKKIQTKINSKLEDEDKLCLSILSNKNKYNLGGLSIGRYIIILGFLIKIGIYVAEFIISKNTS